MWPNIKIMQLSVLIYSLFMVARCGGQVQTSKNVQPTRNLPRPIRLSERIGNFSLELLYHTTYAQEKRTNLIISPITVWSILAVTTDGASGNTLLELERAARLPSKKNRDVVRNEYKQLHQYLIVNTTTVELQNFNAMFVDPTSYPRQDFVDVAREYETRMIVANFSNSELTSNLINTVISNVTRGHIPQLLSADDIRGASLLLTSAVYFKGQWTIPFNASSTYKDTFFDSNGKILGEVNMMYSRYTYPFAYIKELQARILEIPYGSQDRLSMLIMLPDSGVSLENMFRNFINVSLDEVFAGLKLAQEEYSEDEVDCFLPRFKIDTSLSLTDALQKMGIRDLFQENIARLEGMANKPLYVSKFVHKAEIEVTEEGTVAAAASAAEFSNRIGVIRFEANRPFCFLIIEKISNTITFGGFYHTPSLY
ncbi:serine protease inhibitor 77Ba-like [Aricia agestis]|uniref:serine protease inhibitor 77Ba-like n=1 Tax=Aricia agestis TaxID=91739 RepID=UPI001C2080E2|nr:serine protease inhibitor 77Ba-like [Aricia agestis]